MTTEPAENILGVAEAKAHFSELIERVRHGERFLVARRGHPVLALVPPDQAAPPRARPTGLAATAGALGELLYGAAKRGSATLTQKVRELVIGALPVLPFDERAAEVYGPLRARLEADGRRLDEPDLRIASIALSRGLVVVTGNVRNFSRVPDLKVENWLAD